MAEPLHIIRLEARDFRRLSLVQIEPDPGEPLVKITGQNAQGKTAVLDAFLLTLAGGRAAQGRQQVRDGAERATLDLDLGGYRAVRTFTPDGKTKLVLTDADGQPVPRPQELLDTLISRAAFDLGHFLAADAKTQAAQLLELIDLPYNPADHAGKRRRVFDARTEVNRGIRDRKGELERGDPVDPDLPADEVTTAKVVQDLRAAEAQARENAAVRTRAAQAAELVDRRSEALAEAEALVIERKRELEAAEGVAHHARMDAGFLEEPPDLATFEAALEELSVTNARIRANNARQAAWDELHAEEARSEAMTAELEQMDQFERDTLAATPMPVDGLGFDGEGVLYQGRPLAEASAAQRLYVAAGVAMAGDPAVRVLRVTDASLLDDQSVAALRELAERHDFQVLLEVVGQDPEGFEVEDGRVVSRPS